MGAGSASRGEGWGEKALIPPSVTQKCGTQTPLIKAQRRSRLKRDEPWGENKLIDNLSEILDRALAALLLPATFYGAGGAFIHARRTGKPLRQSAVEVLGGAFTANMTADLVSMNVPQEWLPICFFLVGWGGLELVGRIYEALASALERRIQRKIGGE